MFINGEWCAAVSGKEFNVMNPATGEKITEVADGGEVEASRAIAAANDAFEDWSARTAYERSQILYKAWEIMNKRREEIAHTMTEEQGKPLRAAMNEVRYGADFFLWYAEEAKRVFGKTIPAPRGDQRFIVLHQPVGVVAAITPWNYPASMVTRKIAPALAAGCTIVLKPAEATPLCAIEIFKILEEAGVPQGVVNLVTGLNPKPIGNEFTTNPLVKKITFTGSTETGKFLLRNASEQMKRVSLELGGHAPFLVLKDADPVFAAKGAILVKFLNSGQACISPNRLFVHESGLEAFTNEFVSRVERMRAGNGMKENVNIGPLVNETAIEKIDRQVKDATAKGAKVLCGGYRLMNNDLHKGYFYAPTVLGNVTPNMLVYREETFGPVAPIIAFKDSDDILAMANDTHYGLAAYVYTQNLSAAMRTFEGLRFGIVGINDINPTAAAVPFGGMKESGLGREGGYEGLTEYLETKVGGFSV